MQGYTQGSRCVETWKGAGEEPSCPTTRKHRATDMLGCAEIFMHGAWSQPRARGDVASSAPSDKDRADREGAQQQQLVLRGFLHWQLHPFAEALGVHLSQELLCSTVHPHPLHRC